MDDIGPRVRDWHADKILELTDKAAGLAARTTNLEGARAEDRAEFRAFQVEMRKAVENLREELGTVAPRILTALAEHEEKVRQIVVRAEARTEAQHAPTHHDRTAGHEIAIKALEALKWPLVAFAAAVGGPHVIRYLLSGGG